MVDDVDGKIEEQVDGEDEGAVTALMRPQVGRIIIDQLRRIDFEPYQLWKPPLDAPWSTKITAVTFDRTISRYNLGDIVDQFNDSETSYELSGGLSSGLVDGWVKRLTFGMRYDRNDFLPTSVTSLPAKELPPNRTLSYPFVGFDILQDRYKKIGDQNQIGRTEDLYFGTEITGEVGLSNGAFGADASCLHVAPHEIWRAAFTAFFAMTVTRWAR